MAPLTPPDPGPGRVAVVGDVAGHLDELRRELTRLGARTTASGGLRLPEDLTVVQVGDLVHRGPDSPGVVALVDDLLRDQPGRWVQLVGNHEAQYLRPPAFDWPERLDDRTAGTLAGWWAEGLMRPAVALTVGGGLPAPGATPGEELLVTHAGLTEGFWRRVLDRPTSAARAAAGLGALVGAHEDVLLHAGQMLGGGAPDLMAGPVWAAAATELVPSWLDGGARLPFGLVHGHSMIADLRRRRLRGEARVAALTTVDWDAAHETTVLPGGRTVGLDPGHGRRPHRPWRALVLDAAVVRS